MRTESASFELMKRAPSSASAAEERTLCMMEKRTRMAPLMGGVFSSREGSFSGVAHAG